MSFAATMLNYARVFVERGPEAVPEEWRLTIECYLYRHIWESACYVADGATQQTRATRLSMIPAGIRSIVEREAREIYAKRKSNA